MERVSDDRCQPMLYVIANRHDPKIEILNCVLSCTSKEGVFIHTMETVKGTDF
jgi:hypothetical protein